MADEAAKYCRTVTGSENNVLWRYLYTAELTNADIIMRITADCPLLSPELCWEVIKAQRLTGADYCSNVVPRTFPKGFDCEVFTMDLLREADKHTPDHEREHVTPWMQRTENIFNVESPWRMDGRLTLDTWDDYKVICAAFGHDAPEHLRAA